MVEVAFCIPIIRTDYIGKYLETLYKYTPHEFRVFVCDQSVDGIDKELIKKYIHWYTRPHQNLGFAKGANELMWAAYRQGYPYIAVSNDDVEYINKRWWQGILDEFATDEHILIVGPESPRVPLWGYGRPNCENVDLLPYKEEYTEEDYNYLLAGEFHDIKEKYPDLPESFPLTKRGVIDGNAAWHPVFKRQAMEIIGYFDERFLYGGGEDYDYNARVYRQRYRFVASMKSWVWHWWGQSKDKISSLPPELFNRESWNDLDTLWPPALNEGHHCDPWGHYTDSSGSRHPLSRVPEVKIDPL